MSVCRSAQSDVAKLFMPSTWMWRFVLSCCLCVAVDSSVQAEVNFDQAMQGLHFSLDADDNGKQGGNGIPDATEMALIARVLNNPDIKLGKLGGVSHKTAVLAYQQALSNAKQDLANLVSQWPTSPEVAVAYSLLGETSHTKIAQMVSAFGANMQSDYTAAIDLGRFFAAEGDADGDGMSNLQEYSAHKAMGREVYLDAALDPDIALAGSADASEFGTDRLKVGIVLYPGFEVLDVYGPLQMWAYVPEFEIMLIAEQTGPVASAQKVASVATHGFDDVEHLDILMVPGGMGTFEQLENRRLMDFIQRMDRKTRFTTSVCTGSALLAKAGVLDGQKATANKRFFFLSQQNGHNTEWVQQARWVESGKYFTSSGISAGTDMALGLLATFKGQEDAAQMASLLEYEWNSDASQDPFVQFVKTMPVQQSGPPRLLQSEPAQDGALTQSPKYLSLYFNQAPNVAKSRITVVDEKGENQPLYGLHTMGHNDLMIMLKQPLSDGRYKVQWSAAFNDAEQTNSGSYQFSVAAKTGTGGH